MQIGFGSEEGDFVIIASLVRQTSQMHGLMEVAYQMNQHLECQYLLVVLLLIGLA